MEPRIMYLECKAGNLTGPARIGRVTFSKTGKTIYYRDQVFHRLPQGGFKANYYDQKTKEDYWISGPKKDGSDRLYGERVPVVIDDDVREEYWLTIRGQPMRRKEKEPNQALEPRPWLSRLVLRTSRASHSRGSSLTLGKTRR